VDGNVVLRCWARKVRLFSLARARSRIEVENSLSPLIGAAEDMITALDDFNRLVFS
jgi:hypothetical protein